MGLGATHSVLEQRIKVDGRGCNFFVRPSIEHRHHRLFDHASKTGLPAKVIPHTVWEFGEWFSHKQYLMEHPKMKTRCRTLCRRQRVSEFRSCERLTYS